MDPLHKHKVMSVAYQVKQNLKSCHGVHENSLRKVIYD